MLLKFPYGPLPAALMTLGLWLVQSSLADAQSAVAPVKPTALGLASAQSVPETALIRLQDLIAALSQTPQAEARAADMAQGRALIDQAGARPNPRLSLSVENFGPNGAYRDFRRSETTLALEHQIETQNKRAIRVKKAEAGYEITRAEGDRNQADLIQDVTLVYLDLLRVQEQKGLLKEGLDLAKQDETITRALVAAGRETQLKLDLAELSTLKLASEQNRLLAEDTALRARLYALTRLTLQNRSLGRDLLARHDLKHHGLSYPGQVANEAQNPDYKIAQAKHAQAKITVKEEKAKATPDITASLGLRRLEGDRANVLTAQVSVPLPLFDTNRGNQRAALAAQRATELEAQVQKDQFFAQRTGLSAQLEAAEQDIRTLVEQEARLSKAYQTSKRAYEAGKLSLLELTAARRDWLDARTQALNAQILALKAEAQLARLAGLIPFQDQ